MKRKDWLLLAIGQRMEPIQLQKTLFKFSMESGAPKDELYGFEPYNWGPCSFEIYDDLAELRSEGLVEFAPSGYGWNIYRVTDRGMEKVAKLRREADPDFLRKLDDVRSYVTTRSFDTLLKEIYKEYPEFATQSLFR